MALRSGNFFCGSATDQRSWTCSTSLVDAPGLTIVKRSSSLYFDHPTGAPPVADPAIFNAACWTLFVRLVHPVPKCGHSGKAREYYSRRSENF